MGDRQQNEYIICISFAGSHTDFAHRLAADLKNSGFEVVIEQNDLDSAESPYAAIEYGLRHSTVVLPVMSGEPNAPGNNQAWQFLRQLPEHDSTRIVPLLLQDWGHPDWIYEHVTVDFSHWRNEYRYFASLSVLTAALSEKLPEISLTLPNAEASYTNQLLADIEVYKGQIAAIAPRPVRAASDKRAIYTRSMWGLNGLFCLKGERSQSTAYSFQEIIEKYPRCVVTGEAGSGKTTSLYRALLDMLRAYVARKQEFPLPFLVNLGWWSTGQSLKAFIVELWPFDSDPFELIANGRVQMLIDGLDEINPPVDRRLKEIKDWLHGPLSPERIVIITTRESHETEDDLGLPIIQIKPLDGPRINQYIFSYLERQDGNELINRLGESAPARLAESPLFLAIIVSMKQQQPETVIPAQKGHLLKWLAENIWFSSYQRTTVIEHETALPGLAALAASMLDDNLYTHVTYDYALNQIDNEAVLQAALDIGILRMQREKISFCHMLLRDYYAAEFLAQDGVYTRMMRAHFTPDGTRIPWKWDDAITILSAITDDPDRITSEIAEVNPYLAIECLNAGIAVSERTQSDIVQRLIAFTGSADREHLPDIMQVLRTSANPGVLSTLLEQLHSDLHAFPHADDEENTMTIKDMGSTIVQLLMDFLRREDSPRRRGAAWALGAIRETAAIPNLIEALQDENEDVRKEADYALARIGNAAIPELVNTLQHADIEMRASIIKVLGRIGHKDAVNALTACLSDTSWPINQDVRICDLAAIALEHINTPEAIHAVDRWRQQNTSQNARPLTESSPAQAGNKASAPGVDPAIKALLPGLKHKEWTVRRDTVGKLARTGNSQVVPYLIHTLRKDSDPNVRWIATKELRRYRSKDSLNALLKALRDPEYLVADSAAEVLISFGEDAITGLIVASTDKNPNVRGAAVESLGKIGSEQAISALADALNDEAKPDREDVRICDLAARALESIGTEKALFTLNTWLKNQRTLLQQQSIDGEVPDLPELPFDDINALPDMPADEDIPPQPDTTVIEDVPVTPPTEVVETDHEAALRDFLDQVVEGDWHSKQEAATKLRDYITQLKNVADIEAVEKLAGALADDALLIRWTAAEALAWLGDPGAIPALLEALEDQSWNVRLAAVRALMAIGSQEPGTELLNAMDDPQALVREAAIEALAHLRISEAADKIQIALRDSDEFVRRAAAEALGELSDHSAVPELINALDDKAHYVKWAAIESLGRIGDDAAVPALIDCLKDNRKPLSEDIRICDAAANALEAIGSEEALNAVRQWRSTQS